MCSRQVKTFALPVVEHAKEPAVKKAVARLENRRKNYSVQDTRRLQVNAHHELLDWYAEQAFRNKINVTDYVLNLMVNYMQECGVPSETCERLRPPKDIPKPNAK